MLGVSYEMHKALMVDRTAFSAINICQDVMKQKAQNAQNAQKARPGSRRKG